MCDVRVVCVCVRVCVHGVWLWWSMCDVRLGVCVCENVRTHALSPPPISVAGGSLARSMCVM